jgi:hypothetical protein
MMSPTTIEIIKLFVQVWLGGAALMWAFQFFSNKEPDTFDVALWPIKWLYDLLFK